MNDTTRSPGRPRLYATSSEKALAFRERLVAGGYLRKEVLVSPVAAERLAEIAKAHKVSAVDVTSALLEQGLAAYEQQEGVALNAQAASFVGSAPVFGALNGMQASRGLVHCSSFAASSEGGPSAAVNPILDFFQRRKDSLNGS